MVGGDACPRIFTQRRTCYCGRMTVDGLVVFLGSIDFSHQSRIVVDDTRVVHHLGEVIDVVGRHQLLHVVSVEGASRSLERSGRHTTRRTEEELERHFLAVLDHKPNAFFPKHVGDFVRVADRGHRAMAGRQSGKFRRHQHGAFDVDMRIDKTWHDIAGVVNGLFHDLADFAVLHDDHAGEDPCVDQVDDLTTDGEAVVH